MTTRSRRDLCGRRLCCVPECTANSLQQDKSFFRFPKDESLCRKWVAACKRKDFLGKSTLELYKNQRICSDHFEERMFVNGVKNRRLIDAVPTIFNFQSTNSTRKPVKRRAELHESQPPPKKFKIEKNLTGSFDVANGSADSESTNSHPPRLKTSSEHQGTPSGHKNLRWGGSRCAVVTCVNKSLITKLNPATAHIVYHLVPKIPEIRKCWLDSCGRGKDWTVVTARICSEHFTPDDYEFDENCGPDYPQKKKKLKKTAIPSQKLGSDALSEKHCKEALSKKLDKGVPSKKFGKDVTSKKFGKDAPSEKRGKDVPSEKLGKDTPSEKLCKDALAVKLDSDASSKEPTSVIANDNTETYRWPVIDKVYAQWKDHSSPVPTETVTSPKQTAVSGWVHCLKKDELVAEMKAAGMEVLEGTNMDTLRKMFREFLKAGKQKVGVFQQNNLPGHETEVLEQIEIKQEVDDQSVAAILTGTKPCVVNLFLNNILAKQDCKEHLKMIRSEVDAVIEKSSAEAPKPKRSPAVKKECPTEWKESPALRKESPARRKESPAGRKDCPTVRKESPAVRKESAAVRKESPAVRKESPAVRKESPAVRKESPAVRKESPAVRKESPAVRKESPAVRKESPAVRKGSSAVQSVSPAVQDDSPALQKDSPAVQEDSPAVQENCQVLQEDSLAAQKDSPTVQKESLSVRKGISAVRKGISARKGILALRKGSPAVRKGSPALRKGSLAIRKESPVVRKESHRGMIKESPAKRKEGPVVKQKSLAVQKESPAVQEESPAVQEESPAVQKERPAVQKESLAEQKESLAVQKESPAVHKESPAVRKEISSVESRNKSFEMYPETGAIGKRWQRPFVKLNRGISEKSFGARQPETCDKNMLQTVHSEGKADKLVSGITFGGQVVCVNLGKPITQEMVRGQSLKVRRSAKSNFRKSGYRNRRRFTSRRRRERISHTGGKPRISTIGVKSQFSENKILHSGGSSSASLLISPTTLSPQWPHDSQMQRDRNSSEMIPENVTNPATNSEKKSNELISDVFIPTTDDSTETGSEIILENMSSPNADEFEKKLTKRGFFDQDKNLKTELDPKKIFVEEIQSKLAVMEKKKKKRGDSQVGFVAPVRRTERIPVKKKFLGEFEGPAKRNRKLLLVKTHSAVPIESLSSSAPPPPLQPAPPPSPPLPVEAPLPIMSSVSPVKNSASVSMKSSSVKTPSVPVKTAIMMKTPSSVPVRSTPSVKIVSTPLRSSAASAKSLAPEVVGATAEERCFVCDKPARGGVSVHRLTGSSKIHIHEKLDKILGVDRLTLKLEEDGLLCSRCALLLNYVDRIEVELNMLNQAILKCMRPKCTPRSKGKLNKPDFVEPTTRTEEPANDLASQEKTALPAKHVCRICRFKTPYQSLMIFHLRQHLKVNSYRCDFCNGQLQASEASKCLKQKLHKKCIG